MKEYQEIIDKYLSNTLNQTERSTFEERLTSESGLRDAYEMEVTSRRVIKIAGRRQLKARLDKFENPSEAKIIRPFFSTKRLLLVASLVIGLTAALWLIQSSFGNETPQALFAEHFQPYRSPVLERGTVEAQKNNWESGIENYNNQNYEAAIKSFEAALSTKQVPEYLVHFYLGQSLLAKDQPNTASAIAAFEKVMGDNFYQQPAKWYMALAYLELGQTDQSITLLKELARSNNYKTQEINALLKKLEE